MFFLSLNPKSERTDDFLILQLISISYAAYTSALSLFPDMREHDGLLTRKELKIIEKQAKSKVEGVFVPHYSQTGMKYRITNILQEYYNGKDPGRPLL